MKILCKYYLSPLPCSLELSKTIIVIWILWSFSNIETVVVLSIIVFDILEMNRTIEDHWHSDIPCLLHLCSSSQLQLPGAAAVAECGRQYNWLLAFTLPTLSTLVTTAVSWVQSLTLSCGHCDTPAPWSSITPHHVLQHLWYRPWPQWWVSCQWCHSLLWRCWEESRGLVHQLWWQHHWSLGPEEHSSVGCVTTVASCLLLLTSPLHLAVFLMLS